MREAEQWRVGDVRVLRVVENEGPIPASALFGPEAEPVAARAPWLQPRFAHADGRLYFSVHAFVVDDGERRCVIDTCVGNDKVRRNPFWSGMQGPFLARLAACGYPSESIDRVLCTHMHLDHVGWNTRLVDGEWVPTFPRARYLLARDEWEHAAAATPDPEEDVFGDSLRPILDAGLADFVETDHVVSSCVSLEPAPGHTPGHVCVRIRSRGEEAVITGDLIHHPLQIAEPEIATRLDWDRELALHTRREFVTRHANRPVLVLGTHFPTPAGGRIVADADGRRFVPENAGSSSR